MTEHVPANPQEPARRRLRRPLVRATLLSIGGLLVVVAVIGAVKAVRDKGTGPRVRVTQLAGADVVLVPSTTDDFEARVRALVPETTAAAMKLRPFLTLVVNRSPSSVVVAYAVTFTLLRQGQPPHQSTLQLKYPDRVIAPNEHVMRGREIGPGEERLVGLLLEVNQRQSERWLGQALTWQEKSFKDISEIAVSLDAVLFDDGRLVGPDTSHLADSFHAYLDAKREVCRHAADRLAAGASVSDIVTAWQAVATPSAEERHGNPLAVYPKLAADDMVRLQRRIGDDAVKTLITQTALNWSFTIRRPS